MHWFRVMITIAAHEEHPNIRHGERKTYERHKLPSSERLAQRALSVHDQGAGNQT